MKKVGIIVEYNPFHNGHKFHLNYAKKEGELVVAVMSGDFVQRGEPAFINKWERATSCMNEGIDILIELPVFYSTQSAEIFGRGAIGILDYLEVDSLVFGSESSNLKKLELILKLEENLEFNQKIKDGLKSGLSYPNIYNQEIKNFLGEDFTLKSNDILGLEYMRAIKFWNSSITPIALERKEVGYHQDGTKNGFASASGIRKLINDDNLISELKQVMPQKSLEILIKAIENNETTSLKEFYSLIRFAILSQKDSLSDIQDVEDGFHNRLYEKALTYKTYDDFIKNLLTRRYTIGRVQRILIHILLGITKNITEKIKTDIPYVRVLGFSGKGQKYLKYLKEKDKTKIITTFKNITKILGDEEREFLELNERASKIYQIINPYKERKVPIINLNLSTKKEN